MRVVRSTATCMEAVGCPELFPDAWAYVAGGLTEMEANWEIAQQVCREDLSCMGFDC